MINIWVAPADDMAAARALTSEKRPLPTYFWAPDSSMILFVNDQGGDENFRIYGVDVRTGEQRTLTPFDKTRAMIIAVSRHVKDRVLIASTIATRSGTTSTASTSIRRADPGDEERRLCRLPRRR